MHYSQRLKHEITAAASDVSRQICVQILHVILVVVEWFRLTSNYAAPPPLPLCFMLVLTYVFRIIQRAIHSFL